MVRSSTYIRPLRLAHSITLRIRPLTLDVGEHGHLRGVVVHLVVRRELVMPFQLAGVGVERDHAVGVEVVAEPDVAVACRARDCRFPRTSGSFRDRTRRCSRSPAPPVFQDSPDHVSLPGSPGPGMV